MDFLWDLHQHNQIAKAQADAARGQHRADNAMERVTQLEARFNRLALLTNALWGLLKETTGLTDEQLTQRVQELDMADGKLDGKVHATATPCGNCGRTLSQRHQKCLFCGWEPERKDAFGNVVR